MKKRLVKKWMNRYIKPLIEGLPTADSFSTDIIVDYKGMDLLVVAKRQHIIKNGHLTQEGCRPIISSSLRQAIIQTGEHIKQILANHQYVLLRVAPEVKGKRLYVRIITE